MSFSMGKVQSKNVSTYDGAIFLCNHLTRRESFDRKLFGLASNCTDFIQKVKSGATLFLYDTEQHKLHGVFEATSDGAMNIVPDAFKSTGFRYPCQIRFNRIWFCKPLMESEFEDAVQHNYFSRKWFSYGLTHQQVVNLLHLFSSRNRLQPRQNPRLRDEPPRESDISSVVNQTYNQSGSNSSSHGSLKSPCQTCTSSSVGEHAASPSHKLSEPMPLKHRELQLDIFDVAKSNSSRSSLHTAANTDVVTEPGTQEAVDDKFTDDYIPLQMEDDTSDGVDSLSDLLGYESHSSESKGSSDSEENTTFHQPCSRKKDDCHQPMADSKLRADIEGRKSVFARLIGTHESFIQRKKSKTKPFPSKNAKSFSTPYQRRKRRRAQQNKTFPCDNHATFGMPSAVKVIKRPALDYSFVWDDNIRSNKFYGGKPSNIQTNLHPYHPEGVNQWDVPIKEHDRYDPSKRQFVLEGSKNLIESFDRESNKTALFAEVHESHKVTVEEEIRTPLLDFKRRAKDPNVEGGDPDYTADVEEAATKKMRLASPSHHGEEHESETALVPKDTKPMDMLTVSDENCKLNNISLSSNDPCTQMAGAYLGTEVQLQHEQQRILGCCEDVTGDKSSILEGCGNTELLPNLGFSNMQATVETVGELGFGHMETETSLQEQQNQSARSCYGVIDTDKTLILENPETMELLPNHDEDRALEMVPTDHQDTSTLPRGEYGEATNPSTGSEDDEDSTNTLSPNRRRSSSPPHDLELSKAEEMQYQSYQTKHVAAHEISDSTDSFVLCAEGYGSKIGMSTDSASVHLVINELGTNSESRTSFFDGSCDRESNKPPLFAKLHESFKVTIKEEILTPFLDFKRCAKDPNVEGGHLDYTADVEEAATKKTRLASASYHEGEHESETALIPKETKPMDTLAVSDENRKLTSVTLSSNATCAQMAGAYLETEVRLQDEQQRIQGCCEDVTGDKSANLEDSGNAHLFRKPSFGNMQSIVETVGELDFGHVENETSLQEKQNQSARSCCGVVDTDEILIVGNPETMELSPNYDEDATLEMVATDHQDTRTFPQGKDDEATNPLTGFGDDEDSTNTLSTNRRRSSSPPHDLELSKAEEMQYQSYQTKHVAAHEISDSTDSFAVCGEGYGSKIGMSTDSASVHLVINELGTNLESRTSFFDGSCDRESNKPPLFAELHESCKVTVEEEIRTPFLDFKRRAKGPSVEGGDPGYSANFEEAATKKTRLASASFDGEEHESETALVPKETKPRDTLAVSDENCKLNDISLSSIDTCNPTAGAYLETEVQLQDEQQRIQGCCEDVTGDTENMLTVSDVNCKLNSITLPSVDTCTQMAGAFLETEVKLQHEQQRIQGCCEDVRGDTENMLKVLDEKCKLNSTSLSSNDTCAQMAGAYLKTEVRLQDEQKRIQGCYEDVTGETENMLTVSDEKCKLTSNTLSPNDTCTQMAGVCLETEVQLQDEQRRIQVCCEEVTGDKSANLEDSGNAHLFRKLSYSNMQTIVETGSEVGLGHVEAETSLQEKQNQSARSCYDEVAILKMVATDHEVTSTTLPQGKAPRGSEDDEDTTPTNTFSPNRRRRSCSPPSDLELSKAEEMRHQSYQTKYVAAGHEMSDSADSFTVHAEVQGSKSPRNMQTIIETGSEVGLGHVEAETSLQEKQNQSARSCYDEYVILEMVATDHQDTSTLPQGKTPTGSEDDEDTTTKTVSPNRRRRSCSPPGDLEFSKAEETQHQSYHAKHVTAGHEMSDSADSFAVCAEVYGSKSGVSTDSISHLVVNDLLGANSESRTSFFDGSSSDLAEMIVLSHDPGEAMEPH